MSRRVVIDPVTRVEGHGKVTLLLDDNDQVTEARLHIVEFRGFEKFIQGRPYWELPLIVQRLCGICPVSHHLVAAKAIDQIAGAATIPPAALAQRKLMHFAQVLQSHALHFFHLAAPDLLFGYDSEVGRRNLLGLIREQQTLALHGVRIRKFGQQIIEAISGKRIHGIAALPGGMQTPLTPEKMAPFRQQISDIVQWCEDTIATVEACFVSRREFHLGFATRPTAFMSLCGPGDALELYDGSIKVINTQGQCSHRVADRDYHSLIREQVKPWTYMKFPYLADQDPASGWYRVGPLARINTCHHIDTPKAELQRQHLLDELGRPLQSTLAYHWARMIEALHCAEAIAQLLEQPQLYGTDLQAAAQPDKTVPLRQGIGVIEAPRGTLIHHYQVDAQDRVVQANLVVATTHNNQAMNESIRLVANTHLSGNQLTPALLNLVEVAIRAYDPCLSCATHAAGRMPLQLELRSADGSLLNALQRDSDGRLHHAH